MAKIVYPLMLTSIFSGLFLSCATGIDEKEVAPVYYNLGNAYVELGEFEKAAEAYLQALSMDDSFAQATFNLAKVYVEQGETEKAVDVLKELIEKDPENAILLSALAYTKTLQDKTEEALALYEAIIERDPVNKNALYNAGVIEWRLERSEAALSRFREVLEIDSEDEGTLYNIALIYEELGRTEEAVDYLSVYLQRKPEDLDALKRIAALYFEDEYYAKAMDIYDRIIEITEEVPEVFFRKAYIFLTVIGDTEEGQTMLEKAVMAGYKEEEQYRELLSHPDLLIRDELEEYLLEKGLISSESAQEPEGGEPQPAEDNVDSTNSSTSSGDPDPSTE